SSHRADAARAPAPRHRRRSQVSESRGLHLRQASQSPYASRHSVTGGSAPGPETTKGNRSAASGGSLGHHAVYGPHAIELRRLVELVRVAFGQVLLDIIDAGALDQHERAAAEASAHHPRADHLRHPGGQLHEAVKLPAAYRE